MFKLAIPVILVGISVALFLGFANPMYQEIKEAKILSASYNEALDNSKSLEMERDKLTAKYNTIDPANIMKLEKLMPNNVDNIRTILEIEKLALPYGMVLKDVKYDTITKEETATGTAGSETAEARPGSSRDPYGTWDLAFSTEGTYPNFVSFLQDLEKNLRIVDVSSIEFSATDAVGINPNLPQAYKYSFKIKTYWLKN
ncbi:MAG TPA: hypothetical protein VFQ59_02220 [Candidatus Paceibacterota bacterium]|nr:hypothetical protein [Candidatus Paceibacterota bacterium]